MPVAVCGVSCRFCWRWWSLLLPLQCLLYRTIRSYPRKIGGNLLGDVGEINERQLKMKRYADYRSGDYVGQSGVEKAYEEELRGKKGVKIMEKDTHGVVKGSYMDGMFDSLPEPGPSYRLCT